MFLHGSEIRRLARSFPRIRGDVPTMLQAKPGLLQFSPHTRGCSERHLGLVFHQPVFPAYAGMFRPSVRRARDRRRFPRIRGDVPGTMIVGCKQAAFSPHTRGCSDIAAIAAKVTEVFPHTRGCSPYLSAHHQLIHVFPAYAGMFRKKFSTPQAYRSFPRIRGDVPYSTPKLFHSLRFSPHTRGCSVGTWAAQKHTWVFPAYAGMFLAVAI